MGGGGGASPGPSGVLQCESAGLGWPPKLRTLRAGSPRHFLRGARRGGVQVSVEPITFALLAGDMDVGFRPERALWTREEVVNWIAFKMAAPDDLTGKEALSEKWGSEPSWDKNTHEMQRALTALAESRPIWTPAGPPFPGAPSWMPSETPPWAEILADRALDVVRHRQLPAGFLLDELREEMLGYCQRRTLHLAAKESLTEAEVRAEIASRHAPKSAPYAGREPWLRWYLDTDVLRLWPAAGMEVKPSIPEGRLKDAWASFVAGHVAAGTRPTVPECKDALVAAFPDHAPPTDNAITKLRAETPTPSDWTRRGKHKGRN
jgi:hypothetical protein